MKLVLEGGGSRAAFSAGVVHGLLSSGVAPKVIVGSSSGSMNAAFAAAGQSEVACDIWRDVIPGKRFISWQRQFTPWGPPGLGIDDLLDNVIRAQQLLDVERAVSGPTHLYVTLTDVETSEVHIARPGTHDFWDWMRASLALPVGYNRVVSVHGRGYIDGGVACPAAFDDPLPEAYPEPTVVVMTRSVHTKKAPPALWERVAIRTIVPAPARRTCLEQHHAYNEAMVRLREAAESGRVMLIDPPPEGLPVSRLTRDAGPIRKAVALGIEAGKRASERVFALVSGRAQASPVGSEPQS
jgi:predicted patatin/cPLA2 family phospholipase